MTTLVVNDVVQTPVNTGQTWGELLERLDESLAGTGRIVTAARFDGVDEPAFRDPDVVVKALDDLATVEVAAGTAGDLIAASLDEAVSAVDELADATLRVGGAFRGFDVAAANHGLAQVADGLKVILGIASAIALARGQSLDDISYDGQALGAMVRDVTVHVESVVAAQSAGDWISVADIVEFDIEPAVRRWGAAFESLRDSAR